jgi:hypothetical protein
MEKAIKSWGFRENRGIFAYFFVNLLEILLQICLLLVKGGKGFRCGQGGDEKGKNLTQRRKVSGARARGARPGGNNLTTESQRTKRKPQRKKKPWRQTARAFFILSVNLCVLSVPVVLMVCPLTGQGLFPGFRL